MGGEVGVGYLLKVAYNSGNIMLTTMNRKKSKLYRKVNTKARGVHHDFGGDFKNTRNKKRETLEQVKGTMCFGFIC